MPASIAEKLGVTAGGSHLTISIHDGTTHTLNQLMLLVFVQTFKMVFSRYHRHSEYKRLAPGYSNGIRSLLPPFI
jgi:hypothetical protein